MSGASTSETLASEITVARERLLEACFAVDERLLLRQPEPGEWSVALVTWHLPFVDGCYGAQALAVANGESGAFRYFDDEAWRRQHPAARIPGWAAFAAAARDSSERWADTVRDLTELQLAVPCTHPRGIPYSAGEILRRLPAHDETHMEQIRDILGQLQG